MTDKHEVTVYDRVPATAAVSVEQLEAYLLRSGWTKRRELLGNWTEWWSRGEEHCLDVPQRRVFRDWAHRAGVCIARLASTEDRQPSAVLADIAKEQP